MNAIPTFHFIDVGQGNMAVGLFPSGRVLVYDCNITEDNEDRVLNYLARILPKRTIDVFVNSHRDADHMRGVQKLHARFPIQTIWDSGVSANTETLEYARYMNLRRAVTSYEVQPGQYWINEPTVQILNGKRDGLDDPNSQSIVIHVDHEGSSLLLAGDTNATTWRDYIIPELGTSVSSLVLYTSHHGSLTFFNEGGEGEDDYTHHLATINPAIAVISVGETNPHGHPDTTALTHYERHCYGANNGQKVFRTDRHGNMQVELHGRGTGWIYWNRI